MSTVRSAVRRLGYSALFCPPHPRHLCVVAGRREHSSRGNCPYVSRPTSYRLATSISTSNTLPRSCSPTRMSSNSTSGSPENAAPALQYASELSSADALLRSKGVQDDDKIIIFDGVCVMCNSGVDFVLRWDTAGQFKFAALQSEAGRALTVKYGAPRDLSTMIYVEGGEAHLRSEAVLRIGRRLFAFAPAARLALLTVPRPMRDWFYTNVVAKNRYDVFGKRDECRLVEPGKEHLFL